MRRAVLSLVLFVCALALALPAFGADVREVRGVLSSVSANAVTVKSERGSISCRVGDGAPSLAGFAAGDQVVAVCKRAGDGWSLVRVRHLPAPAPTAPAAPPAQPSASATLGGAVSAVSANSVTVRDGDRSLTCSTGEHSPSLAGVAVGDRILIVCARGVLQSYERTTAPVAAEGVVSAVDAGAGTITVHGDRDVSCTFSAHAPSVAEVHVGDRVRIVCVGGVLAEIVKVASAPQPAPPPPPSGGNVYAAGAISALEPASISVHGEHDLTCAVTSSSPRLGDFHVGDRVRIACSAGALVSIARVV